MHLNKKLRMSDSISRMLVIYMDKDRGSHCARYEE